MAASAKHIQLARGLPPRLLRFFARYPPSHSGPAAGLGPNNAETSSSESGTDIIDQATPSVESLEPANPFRSMKHPVTGTWHDPVYSLRRQAEIVKLARVHGVEDLLPFTTKKFEERIRKRAEEGLRVKGTGVGQKVKGHWWERTMKGRLEQRRQAMRDMPQLIQTWKQLGHGRGWKKYPK